MKIEKEGYVLLWISKDGFYGYSIDTQDYHEPDEKELKEFTK